MSNSLPVVARAVSRAILFALIWLVLVGTDRLSWIIGLPAVLLATLAAMKLSRRRDGGPSVLGVLGFVPFFVWESFLGGVDVARRVMRPTMSIGPGFHPYRLRLQGSNARVFFLDSISLLPGTLSADMRDGVIQVHALDLNDPQLDDSLTRLEQRIARLFGEALETDKHG
jgi:multicomponent Na+:H+ antiporter subunit E